jgi:hypothetical protein
MKKLLFLLLPIVLQGACYFPPYREELSLALPATKKMEGTAVVGPIDRGPGDLQDRTILFYPSKDALVNRTNDYVRGFIIATDDRSARLMFVDHGPTEDDDYFIGFDNTVPLDNSDDKQFVFRATTVIDSSDVDGENLGIIFFNEEFQTRDYVLFDESFIPIAGPIDMNAGMLLLGASFFPEEFVAADRFHALRVDPVTGLYSEEEYQTNPGTGLSAIGGIRINISLPGLPSEMTNCFYYTLPAPLSPTRRSYLSVYDRVRRKYRNFSWDDSLELQVFIDMERRIDLLLSNGWLFSRDGNKGYVYDGDGELLNSFVMGGLTPVYEVYDSSIPKVPRVVFTIPVWAPVEVGGNNWEDRLFFLVYWIPTVELVGL